MRVLGDLGGAVVDRRRAGGDQWRDGQSLEASCCSGPFLWHLSMQLSVLL